MKTLGLVMRSICAAGLAAIVVGSGCAKTQGETGDETHFQKCNEDDDCKNIGTDSVCVDRYCSVPSETEGGVSGPTECLIAGGQCVLGGGSCTNRGTADCNPDRNPGGAICCLDHPAETARCDDGTIVKGVWAVDYDRSCRVDADCVAVSEGTGCSGSECVLACANTAINGKDAARFRAAVSVTPAGSHSTPVGPCHCPASFGPCCRKGVCIADRSCSQ